MNPPSSGRLNRGVELLLATPLFLWAMVLLHVLRLSTAFNWLVKHLTPFVVFGAMTLCPLVAAVLGWRLLRRKESPALARLAIIGGGFLFAAFIIYPGIPMIQKKLEPKTQKNPGQPSRCHR